MSSIRVFVLGSLAEQGPMHGYQLRLLAESSRMQNWTDITPGAIYAAIKRLLREGLLSEVRTERDGARPERQIVEITDTGREILDELQEEAVTTFRLTPDPFDLVLSRPTAALRDVLPARLHQRRTQIAAMTAEYNQRCIDVAPQLTELEQLAMQHRLLRLQAEVTFLDQALTHVSDVIKKEHTTTS